MGGIIEYSLYDRLAGTYLFDSHWILSDELFTKKAQFSLKPFNDSYYGLLFDALELEDPAGGHRSSKEGPDHIVRMEASNIPAFQTEDYMPPANELKSRVDFIYEEGILDKDQASFWKQVGKQRNGQLESFIGKRKAMEQAVAQIVSPSDSQDVKLRKIYDRVQQLRNTSYEVRKDRAGRKTRKRKSRGKRKRRGHLEARLWRRPATDLAVPGFGASCWL